MDGSGTGVERVIHIPEMKLIDMAMEKIESEEEREHIKKHLAICPHCREKLAKWQLVMETETNLQPSAELKENIWKQASATMKPKERKKKAKTTVAFASAFIAASLLVFGLFHTKPHVHPTVEVAQNDRIEEENLRFYPETKQVAVIPVSDFNHIRGNLWMNDVTEEMLLEVDGFIPLQEKDYQLWIIYENNDIQGELLSVQDGVTRVLFKGPEINELKLIKASVEPKGGSSKPTGPNTFIVPLENNHDKENRKE